LLRSSRERKREAMGTILSFVPRKAAKARPEASYGATASIIIFPGVRYERMNVSDDSKSVLVERSDRRPKSGPSHH
jgi:hypothetical protein